MTILYRGMDRAALDAAYNNTLAVPDFAGIYADFQKRSAALYAAQPCQRDLKYGPNDAERFDWFPSHHGAPTFIFIHGGYWQNCSKEDFAFVASGPLARGFNVVLAEYTLAPQASMTHIVEEIGRLIGHLAADPDKLGTSGSKLCLSGHSAGGHLSAMYRGHPSIAYAMPISALVDLEPISLCWLNDKLRLTSQEIDRFSPIHHIGNGAPTVVASGGGELPELVRQSREYAQACEAAKQHVTYVPVPGANHFSVLEDLVRPSGLLMSALTQAMANR